MIHIFEESQEEKEQNIADMLQQGYTYKAIMRECHCSPKTISTVKKARFGSFEDELEKPVQISKETQAIKLFNEGKSPIEVAIELDLATDYVLVIHQRYQRLRNLEWFNSSFEQVKGNIGPYMQLFNLMNGLGMTPEQVAEQVRYGNTLPNLQNIHTMLSNEIHLLESYRHNLHSQLNSMANQIDDYQCWHDYSINECEQKRNELLVLNYEIKNMQNFIQKFDNQEGYQRIKKESTEQTNSIIKNNGLLVAVTVSSALEALRRYPHNQELLYELSARRDYSTSHQQSWMQPHTTQLMQLSEQVQIEIVEKITKIAISKLQDKNCE